LSEYLSERSAEKTSREYEQAIASAEEGFAGSGMFFSGIKDRTGGLLNIEKTGELADIATKEAMPKRLWKTTRGFRYSRGKTEKRYRKRERGGNRRGDRNKKRRGYERILHASYRILL
jgi:hypothetical protein